MATAPPATLSKAALRLYQQLEPLAWEDESRGFALAHLCQAFVGSNQEVDDYARDETVLEQIRRLVESDRNFVPNPRAHNDVNNWNVQGASGETIVRTASPMAGCPFPEAFVGTLASNTRFHVTPGLPVNNDWVQWSGYLCLASGTATDISLSIARPGFGTIVSRLKPTLTIGVWEFVDITFGPWDNVETLEIYVHGATSGGALSASIQFSGMMLTRTQGPRPLPRFGAVSKIWDPTAIPGCEVWLAADNIVGKNDGDAVGTWTDLSGTGHDATQATGANQPLYKTNILNSKPALLFDGVNDYLAATLAADATRTIFAVAKLTGAGGGNFRVWELGSGSNAIIRNFFSQWQYDINQAGAGVVLGGNPTTAFGVTSVRYNSTSSTDAYFNGGAAVNFDPADAYSTQTAFNISSPVFPWQGYIAEIIVFNSALSLTDLNTVRNYLGNKYNLGFGSAPGDVLALVTTDYFDGDTADTPELDFSWAGTSHASQSIKSKIYNYTREHEKLGWSKLFDLTRIPDKAVPWLAQFVGVHEPRYSGEDNAAYAARLKPLIVDPIGFKRGTPGSIKKAVQDTLTGTKTVYFIERQGSAYTMEVSTFVSETPNTTVTANAARSQKPGGIIMNVSTITGGDFLSLRATHADYTDVNTPATTFAALRNNPTI